jgi:hypothetical protein
MPYRSHPWKHLSSFLIGFCLLAGAGEGAVISIGEPLPVRILYDNSGSMHPGYKPPGSEGRRTKSELSVRSFHEYPEFQQWLADFVDRQTILDGGTVGMWTFTSNGQFTPNDIQPVHPEVPIGEFNVARAVQSFPSRAGQTTYLTETLDSFTHDFTGLVWLITDNIVETRAGVPDVDVERFFKELNQNPRYRSVHLFKYPFKDEQAGQSSALAVYGILVSAADVPEPVLAYYDRKFRTTFRFADCRHGDPPLPLFPGREHLKLKSLKVDALELHAIPTLKVKLDNPDADVFKEGQPVRLELAGEIKSYLTQHSVIGGQYQLALSTPFQPEEWARRDLSARPLPSEVFSAEVGAISEPIPPDGRRDVKALMSSSRPISLTSKGLGAWLRLAFNGAVVNYTGTVRMSFQGVRVRLERAQMAGIFGIDKTSQIFNVQDVNSLEVSPSEAPVSFALRAGPSRTVVLLIFLVIALVILGILVALLGRKQWYRIRITGTPERLIPLRRLGSYQVLHEGQTLGRLSRRTSGDYDFAPNTGSAAFTITPTRQPDTWDVRFRDGGGCQLSIEQEGGGTTKPRKGKDIEPAPAEPPPGTPSVTGAEPSRPLPRIDRP